MPMMATDSTIQSRNCVRATRAMPMILPNISSVALTELTSTSTTRLAFSSITLDITMPPKSVMNMNRKMPRIMETAM